MQAVSNRAWWGNCSLQCMAAHCGGLVAERRLWMQRLHQLQRRAGWLWHQECSSSTARGAFPGPGSDRVPCIGRRLCMHCDFFICWVYLEQWFFIEGGVVHTTPLHPSPWECLESCGTLFVSASREFCSLRLRVGMKQWERSPDVCRLSPEQFCLVESSPTQNAASILTRKCWFTVKGPPYVEQNQISNWTCLLFRFWGCPLHAQRMRMVL